MSNKFKDIDIKNYSSYFFGDMINIKNVDLNKIKIDEKLYTNILIYFIGYMMFKDLRGVKTNSVNSLYLFINKINEYFEEINGKQI